MDGSTKKRQRDLGLNAPRTEWILASELRHLILANQLQKEAEDEAAAELASGIERPRRPSKILKEKVRHLREMCLGQWLSTCVWYSYTASVLVSDVFWALKVTAWTDIGQEKPLFKGIVDVQYSFKNCLSKCI